MPLTNEARQQLRNFYKLLQKRKSLKPVRTVTVRRATTANKNRNAKSFSPNKRTTKSGRPYSIWPAVVTAPSGIKYSAKLVRRARSANR